MCSEVVQESMKVWAMTDRTASMLSVTWTSRTNCGFFRMLTQNLSGRLRRKQAGQRRRRGRRADDSHLLVFQMWTVSGSSMPCFSAMSSRKSKKNRTAMGGGRLVLRMATNTSSTNFCRVPWRKTDR